MERHADRKRMIHISDGDFFAALRMTGPGFRAAREALARGDMAGAWKALAEYFARRERPWPLPEDPTGVNGLERDSAEGRAVVEAAEKLVRHEITGWHATTFKFGPRIDFNADFGESGIYGFHYLTWLLPLGRAYRLTGEGRYAAAFDDIFSQWYEQRDRVEFRIPRLDPIWYELGCGGRLPVLMSMACCFRTAAELRVETVARLWKTFLGHGRWLLEHERKGYQGGNWQVTGARALLLVGTLFPEFKEASAWRQVGRKRLMEHCERDFFEDGCYSERCPSYGTIGLRFLPELHHLLRQSRGREAERKRLAERTRQAYRWYLLTSTPLRTSPATGDSGYVPIADLMRKGARYTGDGTLLWPIREELSEEERRALPEPAEPGVLSVNLASSGFAVMRTGWERDALYMMINYGPHGGGHTHNHTLDFELFAYGEGLALDTARFDSYDNPLDAFFRRACAHNQVVVNDADMDRPGLRVSDVLWSSNERADLFGGTHDGYLNSHGVLISRKVVFVKPVFWLVSDLVLERQRHHCYTWFLHSPHRFRKRAGKAFLAGPGPGLLIAPARPQEVRHVRQGTTYSREDWRTPGPFPERNWIGYEKFDHYATFATYAVLLVPFRQEPPEASITPLPVTEGGKEVSRTVAEGFELSVGGRRYIVALGHAGPERRQYGPLRAECRMGVFEHVAGRWRCVARIAPGA